jgi:hypothetical protein
VGRATRGRGQEREPVDVKTLFFHLPICLKSGDRTRRTSSRVLWRLRWRTNTLRNSEKCDMRVQSLMSADTTRCHSHCRRSLSSHRRRWAFVAVVSCVRVDARARIKKSYWRRAERFRARLRSRRRTHAPRARPATVSSPAPPGAPLARSRVARARASGLARSPRAPAGRSRVTREGPSDRVRSFRAPASLRAGRERAGATPPRTS